MSAYRVQQSDDDFQRHNGMRKGREQKGEDRFGRQAYRTSAGSVLYAIESEITRDDGRYYRLRCVGGNGPRDGQWVNEKEVIRQKNGSAHGAGWVVIID